MAIVLATDHQSAFSPVNIALKDHIASTAFRVTMATLPMVATALPVFATTMVPCVTGTPASATAPLRESLVQTVIGVMNKTTMWAALKKKAALVFTT